VRRVLPVAVVAAGLLLGWSASAAAQAPQEQGWWTTTNAGGMNPASPDVPPKGLLVQSDVNGAAVAYAAVVYALPDGDSASTLTLTVATVASGKPDATPSSTLQACPLVKPTIKADQGGPSSDAPAYACTQPTIRAGATTHASSTVYQFAVGSAVSGGTLAVAIVPTSATDRVVFDQPGSDSLDVVPSSQTTTNAGSSDATSISSQDTSSDGGGLGSTGLLLPTFSSFSPDSFQQTTPTPTGPTSSAPPSSSPSTPTSPTARQGIGVIPVVDAASGHAVPLAVVLVLAGLLGGLSLWVYAGRRRAGEAQA